MSEGGEEEQEEQEEALQSLQKGDGRRPCVNTGGQREPEKCCNDGHQWDKQTLC